ncbi:MAG: DUF4242 domain-containing protein [Anaerolineales bacterium]|nr:DUF4242 domain-containing protein [Chloroflexota bacterium]MBL6980874.1 DUF4242 domain-containing protein [Anaerolineales bacterium]
MPIYMDRHYVEGATKHALANAHERDLEVQNKHGLQFLTYWFDEVRSTAFCLVDAPDKESIQHAHNEAHGSVPHEIIEVDPSIVEAFLGRVKDPSPVDSSGDTPIDSAFRAIMFTDLKDSTRMSTELGDTKALHLLHVHNLLTRNTLREFQGTEVKHTGDGFLASFASVPIAVKCAVAIQKAFDKHNQETPEDALYVKIGMTTGEPIEDHGDLFGAAVNLAARLCEHADASQILVAPDVRDRCNDMALPFSEFEDFTPKGFDHAIRLHKVDWQLAKFGE